jgi:hypothetical protein
LVGISVSTHPENSENPKEKPKENSSTSRECAYGVSVMWQRQRRRQNKKEPHIIRQLMRVSEIKEKSCNIYDDDNFAFTVWLRSAFCQNGIDRRTRFYIRFEPCLLRGDKKGEARKRFKKENLFILFPADMRICVKI